ncbi:Protein similar to CwfJ C-terminus 1 domain containing protein [Naviculisporaceae sp. PSN 640]
MDSLEDFEKSLAAEKAERERAAEKEERRERKHKHHGSSHRHRHRDRSPGRDRNRDRDRESHRHRDKDIDREGERHKERDRDRDHHRSRRDDDDAEDGHRHKRSRHSREEDDYERDDAKHRHSHSRRHRDRSREDSRRHDGSSRKEDNEKDADEPEFLKTTDPKEKLPLPDEETPSNEPALARDSWMTAPSAIDIDYKHKIPQRGASLEKEEPKRVIHERELNIRLSEWDQRQQEDDEAVETPTKRDVKYTFGDSGSQWRLTKLKGVYTTAEQTGRPVEEIAVERFGSLEEFDDAREEKIEMDRRRVYGDGYVGKEKPTGELYREREANARHHTRADDSDSDQSDSPAPEQGVTVQQVPPVDQSTLNRMRANLMKAKLRKAPDVAQLEEEYNAAMGAFSSGIASSNAVVLDASHNRMLAGHRGEVKAITNKRGRERGTVEANEDMSIEDMVREERRTRGQAGGEGKRFAERIAKDSKFDNDLEYMDENAEKLAKRVHKGEASLKNVAVSEYKKLNRVLDSCPLCHHEDKEPPKNLPLAPIISLATRVYLTLPTQPELTGAEGGAVIVPISHRTNLLECDDDEWEEIRNFMKSLTRLYHEQGREVVFYENAAAPQRHLHAAMVVVPIPYDQGDTVPAFFREAMLSTDEEWSQHKKIIDTAKRATEPGIGKLAFRRSIAKEMPYFHVWFNLDGGLGHVVEDSGRWPKGDLFAREILGGMLDCEPDVIKRQGRWTRSDDRVEGFKKRWRKFDWTRVLTGE